MQLGAVGVVSECSTRSIRPGASAVEMYVEVCSSSANYVLLLCKHGCNTITRSVHRDVLQNDFSHPQLRSKVAPSFEESPERVRAARRAFWQQLRRTRGVKTASRVGTHARFAQGVERMPSRCLDVGLSDVSFKIVKCAKNSVTHALRARGPRVSPRLSPPGRQEHGATLNIVSGQCRRAVGQGDV